MYYFTTTIADNDDCVRITCSFHGTCVDGVNSHTCSCEAGYTGDSCETGIFRFFFLYSMLGREVKNDLRKVKIGRNSMKMKKGEVFCILNPAFGKTAKLT